jgi:hypothetical protein
MEQIKVVSKERSTEGKEPKEGGGKKPKTRRSMEKRNNH